MPDQPCLDITAMRLDVGKLWQLDVLERTFLGQHRHKLLLLGTSVGVAIEVDNVVEIARSGALGQPPVSKR